jgi:hypothetical protein
MCLSGLQQDRKTVAAELPRNVGSIPRFPESKVVYIALKVYWFVNEQAFWKHMISTDGRSQSHQVT